MIVIDILKICEMAWICQFCVSLCFSWRMTENGRKISVSRGIEPGSSVAFGRALTH